ncbi:PSD1 and planctomycete cytochrome C domain-containing protein [Thalassoglobus polymorphus]|uniref:Planctomycete cytochrome C n=1 Tax=Thalassoglobus polymorphus TaxID=2527994 RepID=A0A517QVI1_9PLAN|nr:PSD1 and planctomycete cytochrome C domain-containing protein [Thalassoglobus polymorphus]QDT35635.1 Planctomycete cytochrome C [Thalassoglobus polymorphus]
MSSFPGCGFRLIQLLSVAVLCNLSALHAEESYEHEIKPLLKTKCWACHGALKQESGLRLDSGALILEGGESGKAVVPGDSEASLLIERISSHHEFERMPPEGEPLTQKQIGLIRTWIDDGAAFPDAEVEQGDPKDHWSFQPLKLPAEASPLAKELAASPNPIDVFINRKLESAGLSFSPQADPRTLIRRLYFDMHGLPPTWEQVDEFIKEPSAKHFDQHIDAVLKSPRYGERWGQHWLDIVRYADTHGFEVNTPRANAWPYRDYVVDAFNQDKPYDQFVREQLAGEAYGEDAATGFLVAAAVLLPGQIGKDEPSKRLARQDSLDEMVVGTSATFLGLTLGCARCHDHKFDPLTAADYYSMQAFFAGVEYGDREIHDEEYRRNMAEAEKLEPNIADLKNQIMKFEPLAMGAKVVLIDDEDLERVTLLQKKNGHGKNPPGAKRGYKDDPGTAGRMPNLSRGRYTWWDNRPGEDVFTYNMQVAGEYEIWISWGVHGSGVHTRDARYVLDLDGDLETVEDQTEIAIVDQYYFEGQVEGESEKKPLWSGLRNVGRYRINESSKLILRGGETGTGITADAIVLQEANGPAGLTNRFPHLRQPVNFEQNLERFSPVKATAVRFTISATTNNNRYEPCIDELEVFTTDPESPNVALASLGVTATSSGNLSNSGRHQLKHINDGKLGNDKSWISNEKGAGWVQLNFPESIEIDRILWGRDRTGKLKDRLPVQYKIEVRNGSGDWKTVASSADRLPFGTTFDEATTRLRIAPEEKGNELRGYANELKKLEQRYRTLTTPKKVYAGVFRKPDETHLLLRGDPEQPQEKIDPATPAIFSKNEERSLSSDSPDSQRRYELAQWMASAENPLTARVMVNRLWQYHFGTGLVSTPSDFGLNGSPPSHPELLDWLAQEFVTHNWSIKHIHRLILTSRTWQQSNQMVPHAQSVDADCRLLWRYPSRRLEAEAIRDGLLQATGNLNLKMGGPGFDFFKTRGGLNGFPPVLEFKDEGLRRMIYAHKIRMERVPVFGAFDCPDAGQPTPQRSRSTTAIQALNLMNSPFIADQSESLAMKLNELPSIELQVRTAYEKTLQREPSSKELSAVIPVVEQHGLSTLLRVLFNSNEFVTLP